MQRTLGILRVNFTITFSLNFDISPHWTIILIEIGSLCQFWIKLPTIRGGWKWAQWGSIEPHNFYKMHVLLTVLFILSVHKIDPKLLKTFFFTNDSHTPINNEIVTFICRLANWPVWKEFLPLPLPLLTICRLICQYIESTQLQYFKGQTL